MADAEEFIEWLEELRDTGKRIVFFEFVGHGVIEPEGTDAKGLLMGNDVFGVDPTKFGDDPEGGIADTYSIYDYRELLQAVFFDDPCDPCDVVVIELEACYSAGSIGKAFKSILPNAEVWGYTGNATPYWPFYMWETLGATNGEWVEVKL